MKQHYREQTVLRFKLSQLQSVVSVAFRAQTTASVARIPASVDHWQLQREHFGMMAADRRYGVPHADRHLDTDAFLMHAPFVQVLWQWMISQQWVPHEAGISVAELYISFAHDMGWLTPVNISRIPEHEKPMQLRTGVQSRFWAHETSWSRLQLLRPPLTHQIFLFRKILVWLLRQQEIRWEVCPRTSVKIFRYPLVVFSLTMRPSSTLDGGSVRSIFSLQAGSSWRSFLSRVFAVGTLPVPAPCEQPNLAAVWMHWRASFR